MQWLTWAFLIALAAETLTRLWLGSRQIAAVQARRNEVPEPFRGQVQLADQQKAADYTTARVRLGRWTVIVEALVKLGLTLGGGLAAAGSGRKGGSWRDSSPMPAPQVSSSLPEHAGTDDESVSDRRHHGAPPARQPLGQIELPRPLVGGDDQRRPPGGPVVDQLRHRTR